MKPLAILPRLINRRDVLMIPSVALKTVTVKGGKGVYASSDTLFKGAIFGRDSLEVAEDLMRLKPRLVRNILLNLARLQGQAFDKISEEEPGKIVHEYRTSVLDGKPLKGITADIFNELSYIWGGNDKEMAYYGSVDTTPHYLRVLGTYCHLHGGDLLEQKVTNRSGETMSIGEVANRGSDWILRNLKNSGSGMMEYLRTNPHGIKNQVWKDSGEFYVHENGMLANHKAAISSIEVQGLAYDGLMAAAELLPNRQKVFENAALRLRDRTIELLWLKKFKRFALGTDYDPNGKLRIISTSTANAAELLDSGFFDRLQPAARQKYLTALISSIMGTDFLTDAGIRSRALSAGHLIKFWDYHGSYVTWPKETYDIAKGLRRQGFTKLAHQLENRLVNIILKNREYPEFIYVDGHGRVLSSSPSSNRHGDLTLVESTHKPERIQAWTVSAIIALINQRTTEKFKSKGSAKEEWKKDLELHIITQIPKVGYYINPFSLLARYPTYRYQLDNKSNTKK